jgi:hypothetical protein
MTGNRIPRPCPPAPARSPGERDPHHHKNNQSCYFRLDHDRAHDVGVKAKPLTGWPPASLDTAASYARVHTWPETRPKQRSSLKNKDLTGPATSWMTSAFVLERMTGIEPAFSAWEPA